MEAIRIRQTILATLCLFSGISCQNQYDTYEELQFREIILCAKLDDEGEPVEIKNSITNGIQVISLCIYVETTRELYFAVNWYGPDFFSRTIPRAEKNGWLITTVVNQEGFSPGKYLVRISVAQTQKAKKTFEVVDR